MVLLLRLHSWENRKIRMGGGLWVLEASYHGSRISTELLVGEK